MTAHAALMSLRRLLTGGQWGKGDMYTRRTGKDLYCLVGGLRHVTGFTPDFPPVAGENILAYRTARKALIDTVRADQELHWYSLTHFNDSRKDVSEVVEVIDKALTKV